jgi:hypothetical protein
MFNAANDIDFYRGWAAMVVHGRWHESASRAYACAYIGRKRRFHYKLSHQQVLGKFKELIVIDTPMSGIFAPAIGDFGYILRHPDEARVIAAARAIQAKVDQ